MNIMPPFLPNSFSNSSNTFDFPTNELSEEGTSGATYANSQWDLEYDINHSYPYSYPEFDLASIGVRIGAGIGCDLDVVDVQSGASGIAEAQHLSIDPGDIFSPEYRR